MDCVCGCGRDLPKKLADHNYVGASVALELLVWDKDRATRAVAPDGREALIARGVEQYELMIGWLHGEPAADPRSECKAWIEESAEARADRGDLTERSLVGGARPPKLSKEDLGRLDHCHPESSFTGRADDERAEHLERLAALRDAGVLTADELAAAKARLPRD